MSITLDRDKAFLASVQEICEIAAANAASVDREARFPSEAVAALRAAGTLGALVPDRARRPRSIAGQRRARVPGVGTPVLVDRHGVRDASDPGCDDRAAPRPGSWFESFLTELAAEQWLVASVTSEIGTGETWARSIAPVEPAGDGRCTLEKQAPTVSYGAHADALLITARRSLLPEQATRSSCWPRRSTPHSSRPAPGTRSACGAPARPGFIVRAGFGVEQILAAPFSTVMCESMVPVSHILWSFVWLGIATEAVRARTRFVRAAARRKPGAPVPAAHQPLPGHARADDASSRGRVRP